MRWNDFEFSKIGYESNILRFVRTWKVEAGAKLYLESHFGKLHHDVLLSL